MSAHLMAPLRVECPRGAAICSTHSTSSRSTPLALASINSGSVSFAMYQTYNTLSDEANEKSAHDADFRLHFA
jgi:hypothetical protein